MPWIVEEAPAVYVSPVSLSEPCTWWSKKRIPSFIFGITSVIQRRY